MSNEQVAKRLEQNTAMRLKLWVIGYGYWLLAIGYGLWAGACGVATIHASNLSPYRPFPVKGSVLTQLPKADA